MPRFASVPVTLRGLFKNTERWGGVGSSPHQAVAGYDINFTAPKNQLNLKKMCQAFSGMCIQICPLALARIRYSDYDVGLYRLIRRNENISGFEHALRLLPSYVRRRNF